MEQVELDDKKQVHKIHCSLFIDFPVVLHCSSRKKHRSKDLVGKLGIQSPSENGNKT